MTKNQVEQGAWSALLAPGHVAPLAILLGGVLLHSMNVLLVATVLPSIVKDLGGASLIAIPATAYLAASLLASSCTNLITGIWGSRNTFCAGALIFCVGTLSCGFAASMEMVIGGRFVQGFGGGLISASAFILVRKSFPETLWPRVFTSIESAWSVAILFGPLLGGFFASYGGWRGAFFSVSAFAIILSIGALRILAPTSERASPGKLPAGRILLICAAIGAMSYGAVTDVMSSKIAAVALSLVGIVVVARMDRASTTPLLPSDAFSLRTVTGLGMWAVLFLSIAFQPLQHYVPLILQELHGLGALAAGYAVAAPSMAWTISAVIASGMRAPWPGRLVVLGPVVITLGLAGIALFLPTASTALSVSMLLLSGLGMGSAWAFTLLRTMSSARAGEEDRAASSIATVQQLGMAIGTGFIGIVANGAGLAHGVNAQSLTLAAFWVPATCAGAGVLAALAAWRLQTLYAKRPAT